MPRPPRAAQNDMLLAEGVGSRVYKGSPEGTAPGAPRLTRPDMMFSCSNSKPQTRSDYLPDFEERVSKRRSEYCARASAPQNAPCIDRHCKDKRIKICGWIKSMVNTRKQEAQ